MDLLTSQQIIGIKTRAEEFTRIPFVANEEEELEFAENAKGDILALCKHIENLEAPEPIRKLLEAAPDLIKACEMIAAFYTMPTQEFTKKFGHGISTRDIGNMARAAIQKAQGE